MREDIREIDNDIHDLRERLWPNSFADGGTVDQLAIQLQRLCKVVDAIATEARRAETGNTGSVHEGAGPKDIAQ